MNEFRNSKLLAEKTLEYLNNVMYPNFYKSSIKFFQLIKEKYDHN